MAVGLLLLTPILLRAEESGTPDSGIWVEYIAEGQQLTFTYLAGVYKITDSKGNTCDLIVTAADGTLLKATTDYEIVRDGYSNNENVGSATFTIRGIGDYCGTKTVKFSIVQRVFVWWKTLFS